MVRKTLLALLVTMCIAGAAFAAGVQESEEPTSLTIWSAAAEDEAEALVTAFRKQHPEISVDIIRAGSGELLTRLQAEQPNPGGDILLGIAKEAFDANYKLFRGYVAAHHDAIPAEVRDKAAAPCYYGFSMPLQAFIVNTDLLKESEYPRTWKDLADPKYKGELILANPALSGSAYAQIYMMNGLYGFEFLEKIAKQATFVSSSTAVPESVARGEFAIGVTGEGNIARYINEGAPVTYVYPEDGTGRRFDASGIIAGGPNPRAAELFMDFITSDEAYQIILETRDRRVVHPGFPGPGPLPAISEITFFDYDAEKAAEMRSDLTTRFSDLIE
jgi:iron(III) transport system substrate-binding protein